MLADHSEFGALGAWVFLAEEWDEEIARRKFVQVGEHLLFRNCWVAGCIFLGRLRTLGRYSLRDPRILGVPLDQARMTRDGFISGFPVPISFAHNMDDPRSPHCRMNRPGGWDEFAAYSARMRKFSGPVEYAQWIAADARRILETPIATQLRMWFPTPMDRLRSRMSRGVRRLMRIVRGDAQTVSSG
jgi:hypothetical protein